jgi:hypothetical protein
LAVRILAERVRQKARQRGRQQYIRPSRNPARRPARRRRQGLSLPGDRPGSVPGVVSCAARRCSRCEQPPLSQPPASRRKGSRRLYRNRYREEICLPSSFGACGGCFIASLLGQGRGASPSEDRKCQVLSCSWTLVSLTCAFCRSSVPTVTSFCKTKQSGS